MTNTIVTDKTNTQVPLSDPSIPTHIHELASTYERIVEETPVTNEQIITIMDSMGATKHFDTPLVFHYANPSAMPDTNHALSLIKKELDEWYDSVQEDTLYLSHP